MTNILKDMLDAYGDQIPDAQLQRVLMDYLLSNDPNLVNNNSISEGEEGAIGRLTVNSASVGYTSGDVPVSLFTAKKTEQVSNIVVNLGGTASGASPTLVKAGIYEKTGPTTLTLLASSANLNTIFNSSTYSIKTFPLSSPVTKRAGVTYGLALIVVSAAAMPNFYGNGFLSMYANLEPRITCGGTSLADLPATMDPTVGNFGRLPWLAVTP